MLKRLLPLLLATTACLAHAEPEMRGAPNELRQFLQPEAPTVVITGHAERTAYADRAIVSLVVQTEDRQLSVAIAKNRRLREDIVKRLASAGIAAEAIRTSRFSSSPEYGWFGDKPDRYKVNNRMAITVDSETRLEAIAQVADTRAEVELATTDFEHTERAALRRSLKADALTQVMERKAFYEKTLGLRLEPLSFDTPDAHEQATPGAMAMAAPMPSSAKVSASTERYRAPAAGGPASFDELKYAADVSVTFRVVR